jgi:hypothetical protein
MRQVVTIALVLLLTGAFLPEASGAGEDDRAEQLQKERSKFEKESDPADRAKIGIKISELLLDDVGDSMRAGEFEAMERQLDEYAAIIQDAHQTLVDSGRDAVRRPGGFKELEIALRKHVRKFDDFARTLTLERRDLLERTRDLVADIRDKLLKALFP